MDDNRKYDILFRRPLVEQIIVLLQTRKQKDYSN